MQCKSNHRIKLHYHCFNLVLNPELVIEKPEPNFMIKLSLVFPCQLQNLNSCCTFYTTQAKLSWVNNQVPLDVMHDVDGFSPFRYEVPASVLEKEF